jgi:hypothetical protein
MIATMLSVSVIPEEAQRRPGIQASFKTDETELSRE